MGRRAVRGLAVAWLAAALLGSTTAWAHPLSKDKWSLRTAVRLQERTAQVLIVLEVPFDVVGKAIRQAREQDGDAPVDQLLARYGREVLGQLAGQASLTVDGRPVPGTFVRKDHPLNGRGSAAGGFFTWIVEFQAKGDWPLDEEVVVEVRNTGFTEADIVYSALADAGPGWTLVEDSTKGVLPSRRYVLDDPAFWSPDPSLRTLRARFRAGGD